ncbi:proline-rich receptor-like protein kinase PERK1 [Cinnamomum micranthum f. kanehirae]|uniref:non-specific serine/threonine protein kinase n=1 Tax=Cinnamomum micranthum f. kanehirae TaxID=337451 RepID=A0A443PBW5_9MAGN|nr:proline-rich receptor-like protein kinase PERK1 [Cinnamomum micranthum f. kanehirae]
MRSCNLFPELKAIIPLHSLGGTPPLPQPTSTTKYAFEELSAATDGFSDANFLGRGGSSQGDGEFQNEIDTLGRMHHRHLVTLVGCCAQLRVLIYEYIPNNTLEFHLHGEGRPTMEWPMRMKIALGPAYGIAYLHEDWCRDVVWVKDISVPFLYLDVFVAPSQYS